MPARTAEDVRHDPQPGDVVNIRPNWNRTVTARDDQHVSFLCSFDGDGYEYKIHLLAWMRGMEEPAEVIYIAGGE